jgi:hypothetical protein
MPTSPLLSTRHGRVLIVDGSPSFSDYRTNFRRGQVPLAPQQFSSVCERENQRKEDKEEERKRKRNDA